MSGKRDCAWGCNAQRGLGVRDPGLASLFAEPRAPSPPSRLFAGTHAAFYRVRHCTWSRCERGSSLVEFALVLTVLFMLIFGVMDFSRAAYAYNFIANAASEAARYAIVRGATCTTWATACPAAASDITSYVQGLVPAGIQVTSASTCGSSSSTAGALTVCATWPGTAGGGSACTETNGKANTPGCVVKVQVQYAFQFSLPFLPRSTTYTMTANSQMVISQ
jgi:Flp pilus assembly protein TadG